MRAEKKARPRLTLKTKDRLLTAASVLTVISPLLVAIGINFNEYFVTRGAGVQIGFGGMLALLLIVLLAKDKLSAFKGVWGYLIVFLLAVFLKPIIDDIVLLTGMALAGKTADSLFVQPQLKRVRAERNRATPIDAGSDYIKLIDERLKHLKENK